VNPEFHAGRESDLLDKANLVDHQDSDAPGSITCADAVTDNLTKLLCCQGPDCESPDTTEISQARLNAPAGSW
jgi:hypothetical protein